MARGLLMLLAGAALLGQEPAVEKTRAAIEAALAEQRKSLEVQRKSVARQEEAARRFLISPAPALPAFSAESTAEAQRRGGSRDVAASQPGTT